MNDLLRRMLFLPEQASTVAGDVDRLHYFVIITAIVAFILITLVTLYFVWRYRRRRLHQTTPRIAAHWWAETLIIGTPLVFFLIWAVIGFRVYIRMVSPPANAMDVYVMAKKWMWKFSYPEGPNSMGTLRVPVGRPVRLLLTSRDVIHSFYVPAFRIKQDVLPGRYTQAWFQATQPGNYQILCTEFCGVGHSQMWGEVIAMPSEDYETWMAAARRGLASREDVSNEGMQGLAAGQPPTSLVDEGRRIAVAQGCLKCHSVDGSPHIGPTWLDMYGRQVRLTDGKTIVANETYLTESMMDPLAKLTAGFQGVMPTYQGRIQPPEVAALLEYIRSLRSESLTPEPAKGPAYAPIKP